MKTCIACGMPMQTAADYAQEDTNKDYCRYCARPDGSMQSFEEKLAGLRNFIMKTQGFDAQAAHKTALDMMVKLPAWQSHFKA